MPTRQTSPRVIKQSVVLVKRRQPKAGAHIIVTPAIMKTTKKVKGGTKRIPLINQWAVCQNSDDDNGNSWHTVTSRRQRRKNKNVTSERTANVRNANVVSPNAYQAMTNTNYWTQPRPRDQSIFQPTTTALPGNELVEKQAARKWLSVL